MPTSAPPPSGDFGRLRQVLSLLNYEVPPPGYFEGFSGKVIARIQAGTPEPGIGRWERLLLLAGVRPWAVGAAALVVATLVLVGVDRASALHPALADAEPFLSGAPVSLQAAMLDWGVARQVEAPSGLWPGSFDGAAPLLADPRLRGSAWDRTRAGAALPASFMPAY